MSIFSFKDSQLHPRARHLVDTLFQTAICLLFVVFLSSCASSQIQKDFKRAHAGNTISDYESFLNKHPNSEYTENVKNRISMLNKLKEKEAKKAEKLKTLISEAKRVNIQRIKKIKEYKVGTSTEKQFINDGWNGLDPFNGKLGIIAVIDDVHDLLQKPVNISSTLVILGVADLRYDYPVARRSKQLVASFLYGVNCYKNRVQDNSCGSVLKIIGITKMAKIKLPFGKEFISSSGSTKIVGQDGQVVDKCRTHIIRFIGMIGNGVVGLRFKNGILINLFKLTTKSSKS